MIPNPVATSKELNPKIITMTFKEIKELIEILKESNLSEFNYKKEEFELRIKTDKFTRKASVTSHITSVPQNIPPVLQANDTSTMSPSNQSSSKEISSNDNASNDANVLEIKSPIVGTFYRSSGPEKDVFVKVGDSIDVGTVVCIVEAMKLFNEIESEISGIVIKVLVDDASPVEYDQPLFLVET